MSEGNNLDNNVLVRFLMNEASERDVQILEEWIALDKENEEYFNQIRNTWNSVEVEKDLDASSIKSDYDYVLNRINNRGLSWTNVWNNWLLRAAAVFVLGLATSWIFLTFSDSKLAEYNAMNLVETPRGSRATVVLPDGSKVLLNADSKLTYPQKFSKEERNVFLEGEAFFEIKKDAERQFLVKTPDITVKVFGTSFNVKSYPYENTTETTLVEGSISIYKNSIKENTKPTELKMEPNQRLVLYKEIEKGTQNESLVKKAQNVPPIKAKLVLSKSIDTQQFIAWKDGRLKIDREPMNKLAITLERRYDVKIHFEDEEIKQIRYTGTFENETIEQVMAAMKLASSLDYSINERDIWIRKMDD